ncbi:MAG: hypothetical protein K4571_03795 [Deltaproteobacteria bacterium]
MMVEKGAPGRAPRTAGKQLEGQAGKARSLSAPEGLVDLPALFNTGPA